MSTPLKNLCVYCGSSPGRQRVYADAAIELATALVRRDIGLVYGGASLGLMGTLADAVLALGGRVTGVIPESLFQKEIAHRHLTEIHYTRSMHERKALMAELADGFVALPGGLGTFEELFEVWTWGQLSLHAKPCGLLDVAGYDTPLQTFLDHATDEGFVRPQHRAMLIVERDAEALLERYARYEAPPPTTWVERARAGAEGA